MLPLPIIVEHFCFHALRRTFCPSWGQKSLGKNPEYFKGQSLKPQLVNGFSGCEPRFCGMVGIMKL